MYSYCDAFIECSFYLFLFDKKFSCEYSFFKSTFEAQPAVFIKSVLLLPNFCFMLLVDMFLITKTCILCLVLEHYHRRDNDD